MWEIDNRSPFASLGYFGRDKGGLEYWVVAVRARFAIAEDGFSRISDSQGDIRLRPEYGDDRAEELVRESDFSPFSPCVDYLLHGRNTAAHEGSVKKFRSDLNSLAVPSVLLHSALDDFECRERF